MKSYRRFSQASGTDRAKVSKAIARGWRPGLRVGDFLRRPRKHQSRFAVEVAN